MRRLLPSSAIRFSLWRRAEIPISRLLVRFGRRKKEDIGETVVAKSKKLTEKDIKHLKKGDLLLGNSPKWLKGKIVIYVERFSRDCMVDVFANGTISRGWLIDRFEKIK